MKRLSYSRGKPIENASFFRKWSARGGGAITSTPWSMRGNRRKPLRPNDLQLPHIPHTPFLPRGVYSVSRPGSGDFPLSEFTKPILLRPLDKCKVSGYITVRQNASNQLALSYSYRSGGQDYGNCRENCQLL